MHFLKLLRHLSEKLFIFLFFNSFVDINKHVSLVDVSLSTVMELKFYHFHLLKFLKYFELTFKSVNMYANIVPILGAIIPDPLAIPTTLTSKFLYLTLEIAYLEKYQ